MKNLGYFFTYYIVYSWMYIHARLPLKVLYALSDIFYVIAYKIVRYRVKVVRLNLNNSFPEKSEKELRALEKDFYHHFCDYFVETIKVLHISDEEIKKRIVFKNIDLVKDLIKDGNSCLMYLGHYGNWEWVPSITRHFTDGEQLAQIYRKLRNKAMDDIFLNLRKRFGSFGIEKEHTYREILRLKKEKIKCVIGFIADQNPSPRNIHYWTNFMNQETPVYTGVERIAKKTGFVVAYLDVVKVKRGYYECTVKLISDSPSREPEFAITERYMRELEKTIQRNPAYWLWTHKRWKYKREEIEKA